jgi:hypothetical protein
MTDRPPPLFGEECVFALLFRMVQDHCSTMNAGELKSFGIEANADAMKALAESGFIEIVEQAENGIRAMVLPAGETLAARFVTEKNMGHWK